MIIVNEDKDSVSVMIDGQEIEILDASDNQVLAQCDLSDIENESTSNFPAQLVIEIHSEDGFGTFFFYELSISHKDDSVALDFRCHTPNKYWEGRFGLSTFIEAINRQILFQKEFSVIEKETEDDWKGITLRKLIVKETLIGNAIDSSAIELKSILKSTEIALAGIEWKPEHSSNEDIFCKEILYPLLRRMNFQFVRYTHGKKEYGKDFTFSENSPFGGLRHYGLQAKAGDVSGGVNSEIDELLGQINDAFEMPYHELGSKDTNYISTFIIAISGSFTENAREKIVAKMPKKAIGSVIFLDKARLTELIDRYWANQ